MAITVPIVSTWEPRGLEKSIRDIQKAEGAWGKTAAATKALQGPALAVGGAIAAGAGLSIKAASDMSQAFGGLDIIFGDNSKAAQDWAKKQSDIGLSAADAAQAASLLGANFIRAGQDTKTALQNVDAITQAGADSVAVYGGSITDFMDSVGAAYRGEFDSLEKYNVKLKESQVQQEIQKLSLGEMAGATEEAVRAQAIQNLILGDAAQVTGAAAEEADSFASQQAAMRAELENVAAELGKALLPYMEDFIGALRRAVDWVKRNTTTVKVIIGVLAFLAAAITTVNVAMKVWRTVSLLFAAAQLLVNAALAANPIGLVVIAIGLLVAGLVIAYKKSETFRNVVDKVFRFLKTVVVGYIDIYVSAVKKVWEWLQKVIDIARRVKDAIKNAFDIKVPGFLSGIFGGASTGGVSTLTTAGSSSRVARATPTVVNINMSAGDPYTTARIVKRALEGYDVTQGRRRGTPLALAW